MAYTDFDGKIILRRWGKSKMTIAATIAVGDLVSKEGELADANANRPVYRVACQSGVSGGVISVAKGVEIRKPSTIGARGVPTAGDHGGTAKDVLWLSATAGKASETPVASIGQMVGYVVDSERIVLEPAEEYDPLIELVAADKTLDIEDCGKQMYVTADAKTVTLPATATGLHFEIVNGGQAGDILVKVSPNANDMIKGPDYAGTDNKDWLNTKATARPGDRIVLDYESASGYIVTKLVGTWTQEA